MRKTVLMTIALLCVVVQGAWADFSGGDGSAKNPYIISSSDDWNQLAINVGNGTTYSGKFFRLDADISVSTMLGTGTTGNNAKPFSGTFDGNGHTLTFNHTATEAEGDVAPFRFVRSATIRNLHVDGEINTAYRHVGGLAGRTYGTTLIQGCRVSTVIKSSIAGDGTHGGIVALKPDWSNAHLTIEGCVFDGKILSTGTTATTYCGGFVGYTSYGSLTIKNSIYAPATSASGEIPVNSEYTFYRFNAKHKGTITLTNCYYFNTLGTAQAKQAHSISFGTGVDIDILPTGDATEYSVSGIIGYNGNSCLKYNSTVYAGYEDGVKLAFNHHYVGCDVFYSIYDALNDKYLALDDVNGVYTVTMPDADVTLGAQALPSGGVVVTREEGSKEYPYLITDATSWDFFVSLVNKGEAQYASAYYKLINDITVTTMMGTSANRFKGHFDGDSHTLIVGYTTNDEYAAPFRYVDGAEISNLVVAGTIKTSKKFAGGFIANAKGSTSITNCRSSVTINSSVNGDGTHGGFVAHNTGGALIVTGCVFDGYLLGGNTNNSAGFVGWNETNNGANGTVSIANGLFVPKGMQQVIDRTFVRSRSYATNVINITNCYCTIDYDNDQQSRIYSITAGENVSMTYNGTNPTTYSVSGTTFYTVGLTFDGVLYAKKNDQLTLTLGHGAAPTGSEFSGYSTTAGTLSGSTLTMANANATIYATYGTASTAWSGDGDGSSSTPYIISTDAQWDEFVNKVSAGMADNNNAPFANAYYQLTANITVTKMVGTEGYKFKGHFDGNGNTLTLSYGSADAPFSEDYCAPFRYIEGADIHDLTVNGIIHTNKQFAAGIAGYALNNNAITDCLSSVIINSSVVGDGAHGGFVANCQNNADDRTTVTFTNCAFNGQLLGSATDNCGGFVGWEESNDWAAVKFTNCLFAPSEVNVNSDGSATFSRGRYSNSSYLTVENSYYTQSLGTQQGEMAYVSQPAGFTTEEKTIAGITVYVKKTLVTDVAATDITPTEATISWTGSDACSNYEVRYRVKPNNTIYSTDFEGGIPEGWTTFNNDDDEYNWIYDDGTKKGMAHSGKGCMYSASYLNNYGALEPDNWLVSPKIDLGGTMKVWLKGQDEDDNREHFSIYLYLSDTGYSKSDFVDADGNLQSGVITLVPETETTNKYQEYTANLSAYSDQQGYIAIRHFNCYDEFYLVVDDFGLYDDNAGAQWKTVSASTSETGTINGLTPNTAYEYQVVYDYGGNTYYTSNATLTTLAADVAPTNLTATAITANTATISWKGFGDSYNLRYSEGGMATVTLSVPNEVWDDGSGYQMLLDKDHNTYGIVIPESGGLTTSGDALPDTYANFEYKIPENADGDLNTPNVVDGSEDNKSVTITIPAGTYDWCITNPSPDDRVWIASENGNVGGRQDDFVFEGGKHYTFTIALDGNSVNDCVDMSDEDEDDASLTPEMTEITDLTSTSYTLSGLTASTAYSVYVQSVKGGNTTSEWSSVIFTTTDETSIGLVDNGDNSGVIEANEGKQRDVTLVGRTLYKDGVWNTLCLPFSLDNFNGTPLAGAVVKTLTGASFADGTLMLNFTEDNNNLTGIEAGKPYIVKWNEAAGIKVENPVFKDVTLSTTNTPVVIDDVITFTGITSSYAIEGEDKSTLYLGSGNTLYYPSGAMTIGACRAYFQLAEGITAGPAEHPVRSVLLTFGDEETGINDVQRSTSPVWYSLDGRKLKAKPTKKGMYIHEGLKVVVP